MAMLKMQRINVYALLEYCKDILELLQRRGVMEIENVNIEDSVFYKGDTSIYQAQYARNAATLTYSPVRLSIMRGSPNSLK